MLSGYGYLSRAYAEGIERRKEELIDALYDMIVKLKEEGAI